MRNHNLFSTDHKMSQSQMALGVLVLTWLVMIAFPDFAYAADEVSLDQMLVNFVSDVVAPMRTLVNVACYVIGAFLAVKGIIRLTKNEQGAKAPEGMGTIMTLFIAGIMMAIPVMMGVMDTTVFGSVNSGGGSMPLSYQDMDAEAQQAAGKVLSAILNFVQLIGLFGFVRGFLILRQVADGAAQTTSTAAFTHIIGGTIAWNIQRFIEAVEETLKIHII